MLSIFCDDVPVDLVLAGEHASLWKVLPLLEVVFHFVHDRIELHVGWHFKPDEAMGELGVCVVDLERVMNALIKLLLQTAHAR